MNRNLSATTLLLMLLPGAGANAKQAMASTCAATLQPAALLVFNAVRAKPEPASPLRRVLEARVRELVFMDHLAMSDARPAAEAASNCLQIDRH
jgi:hypothetical protein